MKWWRVFKDSPVSVGSKTCFLLTLFTVGAGVFGEKRLEVPMIVCAALLFAFTVFLNWVSDHYVVSSKDPETVFPSRVASIAESYAAAFAHVSQGLSAEEQEGVKMLLTARAIERVSAIALGEDPPSCDPIPKRSTS